ncbi:hypothetical protein [Bosea sp. PAMC 26642]|uniref:hypothetical protein n=1 Tax=Bosea sp. (strain PAMC 26642) TaxID=1792307 RepID=UPI0007703F42|nr:hypothetical protein [Bosea sp. PAMC 26642]AMJ62235.1 hypothetical protein AXW83_19760 [Bosea sp. PAMC 26642]
MSIVVDLWRQFTAWFAEAVPAVAGPVPASGEPDEARRQSTRDVTLEQLGIDHWSSHTLF